VGCYIWYSEEWSGRAAALPSPLLAVSNVTAPINGWCTNFVLFDVALLLVPTEELRGRLLIIGSACKVNEIQCRVELILIATLPCSLPHTGPITSRSMHHNQCHNITLSGTASLWSQFAAGAERLVAERL